MGLLAGVTAALAVLCSFVATQQPRRGFAGWHPIAVQQSTFGGQGRGVTDFDEVEIDTDPTWGLTTYGNIPHLPCFKKDKKLEYDIAILGAPFDTVSQLLGC